MGGRQGNTNSSQAEISGLRYKEASCLQRVEIQFSVKEDCNNET